jgi:nucleotide-binding universal stress UspA family protein
MSWRPSILCPVDFSDSSRVALRYAVALASHFGATVTLVTVNDPILAESADLKLGPDWLARQCQAELQAEIAQTFAGRTLENVDLRYDVATGTPAPEILRVARERPCDLIVMSSRGLSGVRKLFFGATTERVLRESSVPVLVIPPSGATPFTLEEMAAEIRRVLVPVDLVTSPTRQVRIASGIAAAMGVPLLLLHVLEPLRVPVPVQMPLPNVDAERRAQADQTLAEVTATIGSGVKVEALTALGDAAEEIAKIAADRQVGLLVMGLHASPLAGTRMGSVTYRVLCLTHTPVLALPPTPGEVRSV